jgi:hypothetical protein
LLFKNLRRLGTAGEDYVGNLPYEFLGECVNAPIVAGGETTFALQITADNPPLPRELLPERLQFGLRLWIVSSQPAQYSDPTPAASAPRAGTPARRPAPR